jgi:hypothetical protein
VAEIFAAKFIQKSAFTVPFIMPHPYELIPNQIRFDFFFFLYQSLKKLCPGLFGVKRVAPFCKSQHSVMSPTVPEKSLELIFILVDRSAVIKLASDPMPIEFRVFT